MSDTGQTIVLDNGSSMCKVGFAGDCAPSKVFPIAASREKSTHILCDQNGTHLTNSSLKYPIESGTITSWDDMEKIWHHVFYEELCIDPSDHPLLISDHHNEFFIAKTQREKTMHVMFETFSVPSFYVDSSTRLALYGSGRVTGVTMDCGDGVTDICCVYGGNEVSSSIRSLCIGGRDIGMYLERQLNNIPSNSKKEIIRDIKEKLGYVALDFDMEMKKAIETRDYILPEGKTINIERERFLCTELLFNPRQNGFGFDGIHQVLFDSIMNCESPIRNDMFANIVVCGGSSMFCGFPERVEKEVTCLAQKDLKIKVFAVPERRHIVWIGGSILASLPSFPQLVVTRQDYNEAGVGIVHRKCF